MTPKLTRRQFVLVGAFVFAALVFSLGLSFAWARTDGGFVRLVKATVRKKLHYLQHDEDELTRFATAYVSFLSERQKNEQAVLVMLLPLYTVSAGLVRATPIRGRLRLHERTVVMRYLMSTDYFYRSDNSEEGPLRFIGLYWPPRSMCTNPFADLSA